jgi:uncharacterized protein YhaN
VNAQHATTAADFAQLDDGPDAAIAATDVSQARAEMEAQAEAYIRVRAEAVLLRWSIERYRRDRQAPMLTRASDIFRALTLGSFSGLLIDTSGAAPRLCGVRATGDQTVAVDGMSEGTLDQLYLALRIAAVEEAIDQGIRLPFLADDLFINYDDQRAAAGFRVLAELSKRTQVLFFTHHEHLQQLGQRAAAIDGILAPLAINLSSVSHLDSV